MAVDRKRTPSRDPIRTPDSSFATASSSSAAYSRRTSAMNRSATLPPPRTSGSPPASAYFTHYANDDSHVLEPTIPDASSHFAYSTTLRRHPDGPLGFPQTPRSSGLANFDDIRSVVAEEGPGGLFQRAVRAFRPYLPGGGDSQGYEALPVHKEEHKDTPSARFAHVSIDDTLVHFHASPTEGLSASVVPSLLVTHGYNEFTVSTPEPVLLKFAKTIYESPLILLLCGSALVSAVMGNIDDAISITVAVLIVLTVGFVQERRSEKSLEALNKLVPHHCHLTRDGKTITTLANELVPGDIVTFSTGDRIPADVRLITAVDLEIDESSLTGETTARRKDIETCVSAANGYANGGIHGVVHEPVALAERSCIAYMGTLVRNGKAMPLRLSLTVNVGRGSGVVIATGTQTEFGVIFSMMQDVEEKRTPLQLSMDELAQKLSFLSFGVIGIICLIGVLQSRSWLEMFTIGVSLAVAAIPEGLPIVTTVTLALGVLRMSKRKAIVKKLHSVEALGSVSVICSDKTGTLTKNEQTVTELYTVDETTAVDPSSGAASTVSLSLALLKTLQIGSLCNNAVYRHEEANFVGHSVDVALLNVLPVFGLSDQRVDFTRQTELPFNSERKYMAVSGTHTSAEGSARREMYYIKGSIDAILDRCKFYYISDDSTPGLDASTRNVIMSKAQSTASRGLRVIAMAYGYGAVESSQPPSVAPSRVGTPVPDKDKSNLVFVGFQAMFDPPRKGVADAISLLQSGGVQIVMITGDAEQTALSIARQLGLRVGPGNSSCLTGREIDSMSKVQLRERVGAVSVFARTTPKHKMAIIEAFQARGAVVAMTGDGVNDAPALKMADIGVSMGKSGTDVAKEAADMILVDDNFTTILPAVEEVNDRRLGKSIFHNIQNFLSFQLSTAVAALTLITLSTFFGLSNPLNAMQILFINILMDGPPSQSLGVDPVDPAVMKKPPRRKDQPIISQRLLYRVVFSASIIVIGTLFIYMFALSDDHMSRREQTMTFTCFVFLDLVSALQNRGLGCGLSQNKMLLTTVSISFIVQLALVYVPVMQSIFQTAALDWGDLTMLLMLAGISATLHEGRRHYERSLNADLTYPHIAEELA
ncbi:hypothetical protein PHLGIDRAFT_68280 [Phlebiopsis gigantea 11061_1 CR5-6]|uniref:Cation-transporting P-type ATPase N-terminal domain-containing protein n=1 Tax=Phlebiopsis gigantea (strain 11061_1 CR5-6) TaxID=745531 RepID=A0A0C3SAB2_PHLG1|nr:hypothetical protein PHLGIDRAFT_68280 [Phlebiopsis gigantea 11061_1 CR5-6]